MGAEGASVGRDVDDESVAVEALGADVDDESVVVEVLGAAADDEAAGGEGLGADADDGDSTGNTAVGNGAGRTWSSMGVSVGTTGAGWSTAVDGVARSTGADVGSTEGVVSAVVVDRGARR